MTELGQYFTTNSVLKQKVFEFILNNPKLILEPSVGRGDLVEYIQSKIEVKFDMYEIDTNLKLLPSIISENVTYSNSNFLESKITKKYSTIIGNPPYVRTTSGNLYLDFIEKCYNLLDINGELIFIVPSDFIKLTSASKLINSLLQSGSITHIFNPNNDKLFEGATIDVIIFRYQKDIITNIVEYNSVVKYLTNTNGIITFNESKDSNISSIIISEYFDVYVGIVSGKDEVYKNTKLGNIEVLNSNNKLDKFICITEYPSESKEINEYLLQNKEKLMQRRIRKFNDTNWWQWGALRNIKIINEYKGSDCIYLCNLTRKKVVAFTGKVSHFGGSLIMLKPKGNYNLTTIVEYFNSDAFKSNYTFSGRFKIGHKHISNALIPSILFKE